MDGETAGQAVSTKRVLLVEDHADTLRLTERMLKIWGYDVLTARTAREAMGIAKYQPFDVLLADLQLPDGSGLEVVGMARQGRPRLFAIAMTGHAYPHHIQASLQAGFDHHLSKPFDLEKLRLLLENCKDDTRQA